MGIGEDGGAGSGSITNVDVGSGAVHFAHAQAQAVVGEVSGSRRQRFLNEPIFAIVPDSLVQVALERRAGVP